MGNETSDSFIPPRILARREGDAKKGSVLIDANGVRAEIASPSGPDGIQIVSLNAAAPFLLSEAIPKTKRLV